MLENNKTDGKGQQQTCVVRVASFTVPSVFWGPFKCTEKSVWLEAAFFMFLVAILSYLHPLNEKVMND